jgi:uncharacterized protein YecA (UPF0149 family)
MSFVDTVKKILLGPEEKPIPVLGRNERCWCGSGTKYKACHMAADDRKRSAARATATRQQHNPATRGF